MPDPTLHTRIAAGDHQAFTELFHAWHPKLLTVCRMYLKSDAMAEEALQEIFTKVWTSRAKLSGIKDIDSWLFIIAKNYLIDALNRWAKQRAVEQGWGMEQLDTENVAAYDSKKVNDYSNVLSAALDTLSPQQREVLRLAKDDQLTYKQIAEKLSLSPLTVKTHMQRALQQLRDYFRDHPELLLMLLCQMTLL